MATRPHISCGTQASFSARLERRDPERRVVRPPLYPPPLQPRCRQHVLAGDAAQDSEIVTTFCEVGLLIRGSPAKRQCVRVREFLLLIPLARNTYLRICLTNGVDNDVDNSPLSVTVLHHTSLSVPS